MGSRGVFPKSELAMNMLCKSLVLGFAVLLSAVGSARAQEEDELDPLGGVIADMQVAGGRLAKLLTDKPTQQKQKEAVEKLDALIKILQERRRQNGSGNSPNPDEPLPDSKIVSGPGGSGPLNAPNRNGKAWGQLPAHKREQILQSMTEGFPSHYQQILERYYRRLAEEKPASEVVEEGLTPVAPATTSKPPAAVMEKKNSAGTKSP